MVYGPDDTAVPNRLADKQGNRVKASTCHYKWCQESGVRVRYDTARLCQVASMLAANTSMGMDIGTVEVGVAETSRPWG